MKTKNMFYRISGRIVLILGFIILTSCNGETNEKLKKAKQDVSNIGTLVEKAQGVREDIERLKEVVPLSNEEMKEWLPEKIGSLKRTGFKVGAAGYANVASIEGTYKSNDKGWQFKVTVIDGAGPSGSMMIAGLGMAAKMDMEQEDEYKHIKSVEIDGIQAQQTYHKKRNETALQFVVENRFGVMINGVKMDPEETWTTTKELNLEELTK